jgi:hypothetical protein
MQSSIILARAVLGLLCVFFAHYLGRAIVRQIRLPRPGWDLFRWTLRTLVTAAGLIWQGGLDALSITFLALAVLSCGAGVYIERRPPKPPEDLTHVIFPDAR